MLFKNSHCHLRTFSTHLLILILNVLFGGPRTMIINKITFIILIFLWVYACLFLRCNPLELPPFSAAVCKARGSVRVSAQPQSTPWQGVFCQQSREVSRDGHICELFVKVRRGRGGDVKKIQIFILFVSFWVCLKYSEGNKISCWQFSL